MPRLRRIFGYGSLMWRPGFRYVDRRVAAVDGWTRRFYQGSTDHRGTPEDPGRVVTLFPDPSEHIVGILFDVEERIADEVLAALDRREQGGYERLEVTTHIVSPTMDRGSLVGAVTYIAKETNPHWLGPASIPDIVRQIARCEGPSGTNREYLLRLADSLGQDRIQDPHVHELERALERHLSNTNTEAPRRPRSP